MGIIKKLSDNVKGDVDSVVDKWDKTGLLLGVKGESKVVLATYLEILADEIIAIGSIDSYEDVDIERVASVVFPLMRRVYDRMMEGGISTYKLNNDGMGSLFSEKGLEDTLGVILKAKRGEK
jgi:hypothetical protein